MPRHLFTVGYEGTDIKAFIHNLRTNNIDCILDVRQLPLSRKAGFSKSELSRRLNSANIQYVHLADLGTPKPMRQNLKSTRDYSAFFKKMDNYLAARKDAIENAYKYAMNNTSCLMCFERLAAKCHRKLIAKKIKQRNGNGLQIIHL